MRRTKKDKAILTKWGMPKPRKDSLYYEELLFDFKKGEDEIDAQTMEDIDFALLFNHIDRTSSTIGSQYLYNELRRGKIEEAKSKKLEENIQHYKQRENDDLILALAKMRKEDDFLFPYMIYGDLPPKSSNYKLIQGFQLLTFALALFGFINPVFWVFLIPLAGVNMVIHYRHKNKIGFFTNVFSRLGKLYSVGKVVLQQAHLSKSERKVLNKDLESIKNLINRTSILQTEKLRTTEITGAVWYITELIKFITLLDVVIFNQLITEITKTRSSINNVFDHIGAHDMALSTLALRQHLPYFSTPVYHQDTNLKVENLYHPLLSKAVPNDLSLQDQNLLLTGSNMSGKSTFIKSILVNALCAQVLNTSFSKKYISTPWRIASSIRISDDLESGISYYLQEVERLGGLINYTETAGHPYLFAIDEVFKGTNTIERVSAAKAILDYLGTKNCMVLVSTHDIELADLLSTNFALYHFQESIKEEDLSFDYKIKPGVLTERNAVKLLRLAGYPAVILAEAERLVEILGG